jgi:hypothetical protein
MSVDLALSPKAEILALSLSRLLAERLGDLAPAVRAEQPERAVAKERADDGDTGGFLKASAVGAASPRGSGVRPTTPSPSSPYGFWSGSRHLCSTCCLRRSSCCHSSTGLSQVLTPRVAL